jgi:hypothetical protein
MSVLELAAEASGEEGELFPTLLPDVERLVYDYVLEATKPRTKFPQDLDGGITLPATTGAIRPLLDLFPGQQGSAGIPVVRGWPAYPGSVPAIGVATVSESEDQQSESIQAGFAGDLYAYDRVTGLSVAQASYYAEPLYAVVVVELIHENRDERDRLHNALRRTMFPLRRILPSLTPLVRRVQVDAERQELPLDEQPMTIYASLFSVHVWYEMLTAIDVLGITHMVDGIEVVVTPDDTIT